MSIYQHDSEPQPSVVRERDLESDFIEKLRSKSSWTASSTA
jgi:hypothetical protein